MNNSNQLMTRFSYRRCNFRRVIRSSPKLRIAGCLALLLMWGFATACDQEMNGGSPMGPSGPFPPGSTINYAAVGASDVTGIGSSVPCLLTDCPNGTGYVFVASRTLRSQGFSVNLTNLGIPTAVISLRLQLLGQQLGRLILGNFIDFEAPQIPGSSNLVTIFAGGNDIDVILGALGSGAGANDQAGYIDQQVRAFGDDYATLLQAVRSRAPGARIIVVNLPNFAGIPLLAGASLLERQGAQRISVGMTTTVVNALTSQNIRVIDLMCDARFYQPSTYSADGFHPNDAGYQMMGDMLATAVTAASYPNPPASCAQMALVP